jgi:uncharacterized protein YjbJ (UPF0337 family)
MKRIIKGIFLGGAVGAAVGAAQVWQQASMPVPTTDSGDSDDSGTSSFADTYTTPSAKQTIVRAAGIGAAIGGVLGLFSGWRRKRKARAEAAALEEATVLAVAAAESKRFWRKTRPQVEALVETAIDKAVEAVEAAKPKIEQAYVAAKPKVEHAVDVAAEKAKETYEAAKPKVEQAANAAKDKATEVYEQAKEKASDKASDLKAAS